MYQNELDTVYWPILLRFLVVIIDVLVTLWVIRDSSKRGMNWVIWAVFVSSCCCIALPWYLQVRGPIIKDDIITMKTCPYCAEKIKFTAIVCKHCKKDIS